MGTLTNEQIMLLVIGLLGGAVLVAVCVIIYLCCEKCGIKCQQGSCSAANEDNDVTAGQNVQYQNSSIKHHNPGNNGDRRAADNNVVQYAEVRESRMIPQNVLTQAIILPKGKPLTYIPQRAKNPLLRQKGNPKWNSLSSHRRSKIVQKLKRCSSVDIPYCVPIDAICEAQNAKPQPSDQNKQRALTVQNKMYLPLAGNDDDPRFSHLLLDNKHYALARDVTTCRISRSCDSFLIEGNSDTESNHDDEQIADPVQKKLEKLNPNLITNPLYENYDVKPGKKMVNDGSYVNLNTSEALARYVNVKVDTLGTM